MDPTSFIIFGFCMLGVAITSFNIGIKQGAEGMIDNLILNGSTDPKTGKITVIIDGEQDG